MPRHLQAHDLKNSQSDAPTPNLRGPAGKQEVSWKGLAAAVQSTVRWSHSRSMAAQQGDVLHKLCLCLAYSRFLPELGSPPFG